MNLRAAILKEHSKVQMEKIVKWVGHSQARFDELLLLFLSDDYIVAQRAGYPLSNCVELYPELIRSHLGKLLKNIEKKGRHNATTRNTMRILQFIPIPKRYHGNVMTICFDFIQDPGEEVAVKAFSLTVRKILNLKFEI